MLRHPRHLFSIFAVSSLLALPLACGGDEPAPDAAALPDAPPPTGTMTVTWSIEQADMATTCEAVGAQLVVLELVREGQQFGEVDSFQCATQMATSRRLIAGNYTLDIDLVDSLGDSLLAAPIASDRVEVTAGGDAVVGPIVFEL